MKLDHEAHVLALVNVARERILRKRKVTAKDMRKIAAWVNTALATVYRWRKRAFVGSLRRKAGSGRQASVSTDAMGSWVTEFVCRHNGFVTIRMIVAAMREQFERGSLRSIRQLLLKLRFHRVRQRLVPLLTEQHKKKRLECEGNDLGRKTLRST